MRKRATIVALPAPSNGWCYKVRCDDGEIHHMRGLGAPRGGGINDRGWAVYQTTASGAWWMWQPESMQERSDRMIRELDKAGGMSAEKFRKLPRGAQLKIMQQISRSVGEK